jgi:hypothetical protein
MPPPRPFRGSQSSMTTWHPMTRPSLHKMLTGIAQLYRTRDYLTPPRTTAHGAALGVAVHVAERRLGSASDRPSGPPRITPKASRSMANLIYSLPPVNGSAEAAGRRCRSGEAASCRADRPSTDTKRRAPTSSTYLGRTVASASQRVLAGCWDRRYYTSAPKD